MGDLESIVNDIGYLLALGESKKGNFNKKSCNIKLPSRLVISYVQSYMESQKLNSINNILYDEIEFSYLKKFLSDSDDAKSLSELAIIIHYQELVREKKSAFQSIPTLNDVKKVFTETKEDEILKFMDEKTKNIFVDKLIETRRMSIINSLEKQFEEFKKSEYYIRYLQWKYFEITQKKSTKDFYVHRILGRGGFGEVYGVNHILTGKMYAMKCLDKRRLKQRKGEETALNERIMMTNIESDFTVNLTYSFQDDKNLFLIIDLMEGGDLNYHIRLTKGFDLWQTVFYTGEIVLGLEYLHSKQIGYLDLKPCNVLLDSVGHSRLSDFGLSIYDYEKNKKRRGTPGYMAPEVRKSKNFDHVADYYSLGCSVLKMLTGRSPFHSVEDLTSDYPQEPDLSGLSTKFDEYTIHFITSLLEKDPTQRLGASLTTGIQDIKRHKFFKQLSWLDLFDRKISPPITPSKSEVNAEDAVMIEVSKEQNLPRLTPEDSLMYENYDYVHAPLWRREICEYILERAENEKFLEKREDLPQTVLNAIEQNKDIKFYGQIFQYCDDLFTKWKKRTIILYPDKFELINSNCVKRKAFSTYFISNVEMIHFKDIKCVQVNVLKKSIIFHAASEAETKWWFKNFIECRGPIPTSVDQTEKSPTNVLTVGKTAKMGRRSFYLFSSSEKSENSSQPR